MPRLPFVWVVSLGVATGACVRPLAQTAGTDHAPAQTPTSANEAENAAEQIDPLSANAACYLCHMTFVREQISKDHFKQEVTCIKCHGLSAGHANDEDIGATKPDKLYRRKQVDAMCSECHETHNVPAREVIGRYLERKRTRSPVICTDCHGRHRIEHPEEESTSLLRRQI